MKLKDFFHITAAAPSAMPPDDEPLTSAITQDDHKEQLELDISILDENLSKLHKEAERRVVTAAEDSLTRLHVINMGRCPACGEHLRRHLFASICESCGWNTYDVPRRSAVRVHLKGEVRSIDGDRCYSVKSGSFLVLKNELVIARISRESVAWVEYGWTNEEIDQRHREITARLDIQCGWCNQPCEPEKDGFHMVHVAFGASQERYCFCSDDCFEVFRRTYPARVDRNCYERNCAECNLCSKRYDDEAQGIRVLAKDFLKMKRRTTENSDGK